MEIYEINFAMFIAFVIGVYAIPWLIARFMGVFGWFILACGLFVMVVSEVSYVNQVGSPFSSDEAIIVLIWTVVNFAILIGGINGYKDRL